VEDIQQQLAALRLRLARIDRKYAAGPPAVPRALPAEGCSIEQLISGELVRTPHGEHFETEKLWERHRRHGSVYISDLAELPADLLDSLSGGAIPRARLRDGPSSIPKPPAWRAARAPALSWSASARSSRQASGCASSSCAITAMKPRCCGAWPSTWRSSTCW
jgi:hypothetical protein